ncbi:MAG: hypothetical protein OXI90_05755 [Gammaproteobacteria bacterium]|nr:hypothetical protein [Gammaproteobacteria bacterium]
MLKLAAVALLAIPALAQDDDFINRLEQANADTTKYWAFRGGGLLMAKERTYRCHAVLRLYRGANLGVKQIIAEHDSALDYLREDLAKDIAAGRDESYSRESIAREEQTKAERLADMQSKLIKSQSAWERRRIECYESLTEWERLIGEARKRASDR